MNFKFVLLFILLANNISALAQKVGLESITKKELKNHLKYIASDELQGRSFTTQAPGLNMAANYLAAQAKRIGLEPACNNYFQPFEVIKTMPNKNNSNIVFDLKNVIGIIKGSDPVLKNEYIIFVAHYDHLGVGNNGDVFNGADDNGSGTVTLLEVAEAFIKSDVKPKRSIVFLWVTCEEVGMLGSKYYTENPVFPLEKTVVAINLDMVGRVYRKRDNIWRHSPKLVKNFKGLYCLMGNETGLLVEINDAAFKKVGLVPDKSLPAKFLKSSDHYPFYNKGVAVINYATGYHADFHEVSDETSKINFRKMKKVANLCFLAGLNFANY